MNELLSFVAKNHEKLVLNDRQALVRISNQIEVLKKEQDEKKKVAVKQAISMKLDGLQTVAQTRHYASASYTSPYADVNNRLILERAVGIARRLLRKA